MENSSRPAKHEEHAVARQRDFPVAASALAALVTLAALIYLAAVAYLYVDQRRLIYLPAFTNPPSQTDAGTVTFSVRDLTLHAWVVNPGRPNAVMYFGGNGEGVERSADWFRSLLGDKTIYLLPYRGYSGNPGQPSESALYADALAEFDEIRPRFHSVDVVGRSLGTGVATFVAAHRAVGRLVLVTPYDSIENVAAQEYPWVPVSWVLKDKFESWRRAPAIQAPTLVLVAGRDQVIARARTDALIRSFRRRPDVVVIPGAGHVDISDSPNYAAAMAAFLSAP